MRLLTKLLIAIGHNAATVALSCLLLGALPASAQSPKPQYGGTLSLGTVFSSLGLSPQTWDPADWQFQTGTDAGFFYDRLFTADLSKSTAQGGPYPFKSDGFLPADGMRGDLAEKWRWLENPLRLEVSLRKGVMFPEKPGVMAARELVAQDVVYSYNRLLASPKRVPGFVDYIERIEAPERHTVVITLKHFHEDWGFRLGWGVYSSIYPKEVVDAGINDWKKANGSGPFQLTEYVNGNSQTYTKNAQYWGKEKIGAQDYKLPFVDKVVVRIIKDTATQLTALRTAKLDVLQRINWGAVEELKKSAPQLQWARWLAHGSPYMAMRVDTKPFDDIRVRRALNMAVNRKEMIASLYGGHGEIFAYPQHPDFIGYYEPLEAMHESVREQFAYDPEKAKKLLAEAGYAKGFTIKAQLCTCATEMADLASVVAAYLEKIGVKLELEPLEPGAFYSMTRNGKNAPGFFLGNSHGGPTTTLRKNFVRDQYTNNSHWVDPAFEARLEAMYREPNEAARQKIVKELTREIVDKAPYLWLPTPYTYAAWWPWVKGYAGEIYAGGFRTDPIFARMWVDQDLKKKMGY